MDIQLFFGSETFALIVVPVLIFFARILDVGLDTIRIIFISRGFKYIAPVVGFFEISIWLLAIGQIFQNLTNISYYLAYASGFAMGTFVGMHIENKLSMGMEIVRIITGNDAFQLIENLKSKGFGVTSIDAEGINEKVKIVFTVVNRSDLKSVIEAIKKHNPNAFYSVEDVRFASEALPPYKKKFMLPGLK